MFSRRFTLRRLFIYVTIAAIICGCFYWFGHLTGVPDVDFVQRMIDDNSHPMNAREWGTAILVTSLLMVSVLAGCSGLLVIMFQIGFYLQLAFSFYIRQCKRIATTRLKAVLIWAANLLLIAVLIVDFQYITNIPNIEYLLRVFSGKSLYGKPSLPWPHPTTYSEGITILLMLVAAACTGAFSIMFFAVWVITPTVDLLSPPIQKGWRFLMEWSDV